MIYNGDIHSLKQPNLYAYEVSMDIAIQVWAAGFYLLNKVFFALAEGKSPSTKRKLKLWGWAVYILGVPGWVIILAQHHNWIAASVESGGLPSMFLGLYVVYYSNRQPSRAVTLFTKYCVYVFLFIGLSYSLYDYGGLTSVRQFLEMAAMAGFLIGSYLLARNDNRGWLFYMVMNTGMIILLFIQGKPLLSLQQVVSLSFVIYGYTVAVRESRKAESVA
jgi:nicotinamide riboside transporter PnuC